MASAVRSLVRGLALLALVTVGVVAIVATPPPLPPAPEIIQFDVTPLEACPGTEVTVVWQVDGARQVTLSASPTDATQPELDQHLAASAGSLEVTVFADFELELAAEGTEEDASMTVTIMVLSPAHPDCA